MRYWNILQKCDIFCYTEELDKQMLVCKKFKFLTYLHLTAFHSLSKLEFSDMVPWRFWVMADINFITL